MEQEKYLANTFNEYKDFIKDKQVSFVVKKTERIAYGVYMLSHFIPSQETLTQDLKKTSSSLLGHISSFVNIHAITHESVSHAHSLLQYLSSLLTLSFMEGYISQSNIQIMKHEINYLHKHIEELSTRSTTDASQIQFKAEQFVIPQFKSPRPSVPHVDVIKKTQGLNPKSKMSFNKKTQGLNPQGVKPPFPILGEDPVSPKENTESRESRVVDVIRDKGIVSIKDISTIISDVSEKTIQRTLQTLIDKGQIIKEGERRWARYQLK